LLPILVIALILFCTISTIRRDRALSKSILALCGVISAGCAVITSFGLLSICGVRLVQIALITPFLVLSIGIDDMFLMLATWNRIVAQNKSVPLVILLQKTYEQSVCSILLTTIDNVLVFIVGTISIFPIMRIFCIYCVVSLIVVFIFQATLFGACITLDGVKQFTGESSFICIPF
uniref:SSD domain-containing protein n=1 Tax=Parascaris univalens TaxID=6257 RepID=A0A915CGQ4_PARUN